MGCAVSQTVGPSRDPSLNQQQADDSDSEAGEVSKRLSVVFKVLPSEEEARDKFEQDGTLLKNSDSGHLALRQMLDEPLSQNALGKFAAKIQVLDIFMCWIDIQEYKLIPTDSYRRSKALHIYHKYVKDDAALMVGVTSPQERQHLWTQLQNSRDFPALLSPQFYDSIQSKCFMQMYHHIYLPFKEVGVALLMLLDGSLFLTVSVIILDTRVQGIDQSNQEQVQPREDFGLRVLQQVG